MRDEHSGDVAPNEGATNEEIFAEHLGRTMICLGTVLPILRRLDARLRGEAEGEASK